jgi:hypothetical protein
VEIRKGRRVPLLAARDFARKPKAQVENRNLGHPAFQLIQVAFLGVTFAFAVD